MIFHNSKRPHLREKGLSMARGRIPSLEALEARISKWQSRIEKGEAARVELAKDRKKYRELQSPEYREKRKKALREQLERAQRQLERLEGGNSETITEDDVHDLDVADLDDDDSEE